MSKNLDKEIDKILDYIDHAEEMDEANEGLSEEMLNLLDTEEGTEAWREIQDLDEAAQRTLGRQPDVDAAWEQFRKKNLTEKPTAKGHGRTVSLLWRSAVAVAAVALLLFLLNKPNTGEDEAIEGETLFTEIVGGDTEVGSAARRQEGAAPSKTVVVEVPAGETMDVVLPDGTKVCLNAKSKLKYPERFAHNIRKVELTGEGYFKVSHDKKHPFVIHTAKVTTRVLGTEFNIRCYNDNDVHVTLVEGSVEVANNNNKVRISPNQDASLSEGKLVVANVNPKDFTSWREGLMYFDEATLQTILQQIGSWYNVSVVCKDVSLLDRHFHYMFSTKDSLTDAIKLLNESSDLNIDIEDNTIIVK